MNWDKIFQELREKYQDNWEKIAWGLLEVIKEHFPAISFVKKKLSNEKIMRIRELAREGLTSREISHQLGISTATVSRYGKGCFIRKPGRPKSE